MSVGPVRDPSLPPAPPPPAPVPAPARVGDHQGSPFSQVLHGLAREVASGESAMRGALDATRAGRDLGPAELIALQAGVYRYSEAVDLAAKLVDRATSGVKTIVQGQG